MPKGRLVFDGDNIYTEKDARIYKLKTSVSSKIDAIPWVVDSLDSTSATDALSANMGRTLQDQINSLSWTWKFLSTWDCTTWLPGTNPQEDPYTYKVWDYYVVSVTGSTNYKPHWGTYTQWVPSTTVELENVWTNDKYYFDGADWVRIPDTAIQISIDSTLSTTSTNAVENRAIANAINTKQDIILDLNTIRSWAAAGSTALQRLDNITELTNNAGYQTAWDVTNIVNNAISTLAPDWVWTWVLTLQKNATTVDTFSANATQNKTINITVPTTVAELSDASDYATKADVAWDLADYVQASDLWAVATSNNYNDLDNKPTIPTVNNAALVIQKNGTNVATFTANAAAAVTANISVPTTVAELSDASDYATKGDITNLETNKQDTLVSGTNIKTINNESILWSGNIEIQWWNTYNAWPWIIIWDYSDYSAMRWPCPEGFHVPSNDEWTMVKTIWTTLWWWNTDWTNLWIALKMPFAGFRWYSSGGITSQGGQWLYWSSTFGTTYYGFGFILASSAISTGSNGYRGSGYSIRCFKDVPIVPTSSWVKLYWISIENWWIFWSSASWLISLSSDWQTRITIQDKNLWATTVWNSWDTLSEANCWKYYQRWNNYGFPRTWNITTSSTQVDASNYGPWNYYLSSTFITSGGIWDSSNNPNLRWWVTGAVVIPNAIYVDMDYINSHIN